MSTSEHQNVRTHNDIEVIDERAARTAATGRIRGGSVLGGAVVGLGTLLLLELILMTTGLSGATVTAEGQSGGSFAWDAIAAAISFFIAGLVAGAAVPHCDAGTGVLNGITTWATIIIGMLLITGAVGTSLFGALGDVLNSQQSAITNAASNVTVTQEAADTFKDAAGWAALSGAITLALCAIGGLIGSKTKDTDVTKTVRR